MRHKEKDKLGRKVGNRKALLMNLACQLITYRKIKTTDAKLGIKVIVEPLITMQKKVVYIQEGSSLKKFRRKTLLKYYLMISPLCFTIDLVAIQELSSLVCEIMIVLQYRLSNL